LTQGKYKRLFFNAIRIDFKNISKKVRKNIASFKKGCIFAPAKQSNRVLFLVGPVVQLG
jgi:hypothetical protein